MPVLAFFAFLSGIITILSPCILPVIPIVLSGSIGGRRKPLGVITGFIASFSVFTLFLSAIVKALQIPPDSLRIVSVVLIAVFGLVMTVPWLQERFELAASRLANRKQGPQRNGFTGGVIVGAGLGLVWTPCVGPIMASVISLAISSNVNGGTVLIILAYSLGTSIPMLGVMLGGKRLLKRLPKHSGMTVMQRVFGILMILTALSIGFGLDRKFQSAVLEVFPNYGSGLTALENIEPVRQALERQNTKNSKEPSPEPLSWNNPPTGGRTGSYGQAPEIIAGGPWFNTDGPLSMEDLRGKVVLVDFWTYSCVNCVRTLPYLRSWHDAYSDEGLVIIGVHSPEFVFERNPSNVEKAISELSVTWPVVLDNDFEQWNSYNNRYWPAHYFIDAEGEIRYFHLGEGEYETSEKVIRQLLKEAGNKVSERTELKKEEDNKSLTPETYLGYHRTKGFLPENGLKPDETARYTIPSRPENGEWSLDGDWLVTGEYIIADSEGSLELGLNAEKVFLVIEPMDDNSRMEIYADGKKAADTADQKDGILFPKESRLYHLAEFSEAGEHLLRLDVSGYMRLYAFTFG